MAKRVNVEGAITAATVILIGAAYVGIQSISQAFANDELEPIALDQHKDSIPQVDYLGDHSADSTIDLSMVTSDKIRPELLKNGLTKIDVSCPNWTAQKEFVFKTAEGQVSLGHETANMGKTLGLGATRNAPDELTISIKCPPSGNPFIDFPVVVEIER